MSRGGGSPPGPALSARHPMPVPRVPPHYRCRSLATRLLAPGKHRRTAAPRPRHKLSGAEPTPDPADPWAARVRNERPMAAGDLWRRAPGPCHPACTGSTSHDRARPAPFVPDQALRGSHVAASTQTPPGPDGHPGAQISCVGNLSAPHRTNPGRGPASEQRRRPSRMPPRMLLAGVSGSWRCRTPPWPGSRSGSRPRLLAR